MKNTIIIAALATALGAGLIGLPFTSGAGQAVAAEPGHKHGTGEKHKLGRQAIGEYTVSVILIGEVAPGDHVDFDIKLIDARTDPKALRVWIGTADGAGSKKATGTKGQTTYTGEIDVPAELPKGARLWVELETDAGKKTGSYNFDQHDHKH